MARKTQAKESMSPIPSPQRLTNPESITSLFQRGSAWLPTDFHMRTLADKEFSFSRHSNYFVSDYVGALKSAGIRVGVITNHNKFDRDEIEEPSRRPQKQSGA
jgi:hypothetical protein